MTPLRRRMIEDMQLRGLTPRTQQVYLDAITNLARHYPTNIPYLAHSSPFILLFLSFNSPPMMPYHGFMAERDFQKPSSQDLQ